MSSADRFRNEYLAVPVYYPDGWDKAVELWCQYYWRTENYDRHLVRNVSGGCWRHGDAFPYDRKASNAFALYCKRELSRDGAGIPEETMKEAREAAGRLSYADQWHTFMGYPLPVPE